MNVATYKLSFSSDNDIGTTTGIIAGIILFIIGIPALVLVLFIYIIKRRHAISHQKFENEKDDETVNGVAIYDAEETTVSVDNSTYEKH